MSNYNINWTSSGTQGITGKSTIELPANTYDVTSTSLTLTGRGVATFGEIQQQNYIRLLESFASVTPPANPTIGQLWYDATPVTGPAQTGQTLYVCVGLAPADLYSVPPSLVVQFANAPGYWVTVSNNSIPQAAVIAALGGITPIDRAGTTGLTGLAGGTMTGPLILSGDPTEPKGAATKQYVDAATTGFNVKAAVKAATTINLSATYDNGTAGVGATLTNTGTLGTFGVDGYSAVVGDRILVKNQTDTTQNGVYSVTTLGSGTVAWVLTRDATYDGSTGNAIHAGDFFFVTYGGQGGSGWIEQSAGTGALNDAVVGTDAITYTQFSGGASYAAGKGLSLAGTTFANAGVTSIVAGSNISVSSATGDLVINVIGTVPSATAATVAQNAANIAVNTVSTGTLYPVLSTGTSGNIAPGVNTGLTFNAGTNTLTSTTFNGNLTGTATNATIANTTVNIAGGATGSVPYQNGAGQTALLGIGTAGQVLYTSAGGLPSWGDLPAQTFGTVTSVALTAPSIFAVTGSPITSSGTLALTLASQTAKTFFAAPNGANGLPTFRAIVASDIPTLNQSTTGNAATATSAASATTATTASTANALNTNAGVTTITYAGNAGQPTWLLGTNSGTNYQVWNPSNFSVAYAATAGSSASEFGVGQTWQNVTGSRAASTNYTNSTGKPIMVHVLAPGSNFQAVTLLVNGVGIAYSNSGSSGASDTVSAVVPNGAVYSVTGPISTWYELR